MTFGCFMAAGLKTEKELKTMLALKGPVTASSISFLKKYERRS